MMRLEENVDFEMVPGEGENWDIRILTGEFVETVINFNKIHVSDDEEYLNFNFEIVTSPDPELSSDTNKDLQNYVSMVLSNILENAVTMKGNKID
tara:strand:- start:1667 stop:1951 length:285 start_codon:yes stop_codon:yes gene_type:complete